MIFRNFNLNNCRTSKFRGKNNLTFHKNFHYNCDHRIFHRMLSTRAVSIKNKKWGGKMIEWIWQHKNAESKYSMAPKVLFHLTSSRLCFRHIYTYEGLVKGKSRKFIGWFFVKRLEIGKSWILSGFKDWKYFIQHEGFTKNVWVEIFLKKALNSVLKFIWILPLR